MYLTENIFNDELDAGVHEFIIYIRTYVPVSVIIV